MCIRDKLPRIDTQLVTEVFRNNLNLIFNACSKKDKENIAIALETISDNVLQVLGVRLQTSLIENSNTEESIEKNYFSIFKVKKLLGYVDELYGIDEDKKVYNFERREAIEELHNRLHIYKRFLDNKELFTNEEKTRIYESIDYNNDKGYIIRAEEIIKSKFKEENIDEEFNIEDIVKKYYMQSNEPLNDNTALIEVVKKSFRKPTIKEKFKKIISIKQKEIPTLPPVTEVLRPIEQSSMRASIKYEAPIMHEINTEEKKKGFSRGNEESTR